MSSRNGMSPERKTIDELLRETRDRLDRLTPADAHAAAHCGALLVDIRSERRSASPAQPMWSAASRPGETPDSR
jgi:hypothetical protein